MEPQRSSQEPVKMSNSAVAVPGKTMRWSGKHLLFHYFSPVAQTILPLSQRQLSYFRGSTTRQQDPKASSNNVIYVAIWISTNTIPSADHLDRQLLLAIVAQVPGYDVVRLVDMEKIAETVSRIFRLATTHTDLN